jgi:hypothetical protein
MNALIDLAVPVAADMSNRRSIVSGATEENRNGTLATRCRVQLEPLIRRTCGTPWVPNESGLSRTGDDAPEKNTDVLAHMSPHARRIT